MATHDIGRRSLTKDQVREIFAQHFAGTYTVAPARVIGRDFVVKKSGWVGVGVLFKPGDDGGTIVYTPMIPNMLLRALFGGLIVYLFLRGASQQLEAEVTAFVQSEATLND